MITNTEAMIKKFQVQSIIITLTIKLNNRNDTTLNTLKEKYV